MMHAPDQNASPDHAVKNGTRVILLGASNLTRGLPIVFETARHMFGRPVEVCAAIGHGRSYGKRSRVLIRSLSGILESPLWSALNGSTGDRNTVALVTDVGNDIIYGVPPHSLLEWVRNALDHLESAGAKTAITTLPIASIKAAPRWQTHLAKLITYTGSGPDIDTAIAQAEEVDAGVRAIAEQRNVALVEQQADWYGFDPIHIASRHWPQAARSMLGPLVDNPAEHNAVRWSLTKRLNIRLARPESMRLLGVTLRRKQPARRFPDGSTLSLY